MLKRFRLAASSCAFALTLGSAAQAVELEFYFPVAVGGGAADIIQKMTDDYMAQNPDVAISAV